MSKKPLQGGKPAKLYFCALPGFVSKKTETALLDALPVYRKEKAERYFKSGDRILSAAAWHLLRHAVFKDYGFDAFSFSVCCDMFRKPFFCKDNQPLKDIHFNISHCRSAVVCATDCSPLGIDIEPPRQADFEIARRVMPKCYDKLISLKTPKEQDELFVRSWTETESVYKAGFVDGKKAENYCLYNFNCDDYYVSLCAKRIALQPELSLIAFESLTRPFI